MFSRRTCAIMNMVRTHPEEDICHASPEIPPSMSSENEAISILDVSKNYVSMDVESRNSNLLPPVVEATEINVQSTSVDDSAVYNGLPPPSPEDPYASENDTDDPNYSLHSSENYSSSGGEDNNTAILTVEEVVEENENLDNESKSRSRKRKKNPELWKRNIIKMNRNKGLAYNSWNGKEKPARTLKPPCDNCRLKCSEKINPDLRKKIFKEYYALADINRQRDFISKFVDFIKTRRIRKRRKASAVNTEGIEEVNIDTTDSRRQLTYQYFLNNDSGQRTRVCKTFFLNTLSISAQTIRTVAAKKTSTGTILQDKRGRVLKNSKLDERYKEHVRAHINSFQTVESHYCRKKTNRLYLPSSLNITKMYSLFQEYCQENNITEVATQSMYREIFNSEFNFSFFIPKKDLCDICNQYDLSNVDQKIEMQNDYDTHVLNKTLARDAKNFDKDKAIHNSNFCAAVFDLQQILPVPKSEVGLCYYKLKLSTYNFTVYNLGNRDCFCYMWPECLAKRGSSEIGSCLIDFIQHHVEKGSNEFSFYSDNCGGQNRNKYLFSMYNYMVQKYGIIIRHTYLERGHTQNEGDSVHSTIEHAARHVPIFSPDQWYTLVRTARKRQPYIVKELSQEDIFDLKTLQQKTTINFEKDEQNEKVSWLKIKIAEFTSKSPNIMFFKYNYDKNTPFKKINLIKKGRKQIQALNAENSDGLGVLYSKPIPLSQKKYDHLQFLCSKLVIGSQYHAYFRNLPVTKNREPDSDSESE